MKTFTSASVGGESSPVAMASGPVLNSSEGLGAEPAGEAIYARLCDELDAAFAAMEVTWAAWRACRPDEDALNAYLNSLSECNVIHQLLKKFPQYDTFETTLQTGPARKRVGAGFSHGSDCPGGMGGEGMDERTVRGGGGVLRCSRRSPLLGAAVSRGVAAGDAGHRGGILRVRRARPVMAPEIRVLWVALATVCGVPAIALVIHLISKL